jgi:hypothetical protein
MTVKTTKQKQGSDIGEKRDLVCNIVNGEEEETNLPSQCDAYGKLPSPHVNNHPVGENEEEGNFGHHVEERREEDKNDFVTELSQIQLKQLYHKKCTSGLGRKAWKSRSTLALQHIIKICGYNDVEKMEGNFDIFNVVIEMMGHVRKNLMKVTKLTSNQSQQSENLRDGSDALTDEDVEVEVKIEVEKLEAQLVSLLPMREYNATKHMISRLTDDALKIRTRYMIFKDIHPYIEKFSVEDEGDFSKKIATNRNEKLIESLQRNSIPTVHLGARVSLAHCYDCILGKIQKILTQHHQCNLSIDDVLKNSFIVGCADGAVHDALCQKKMG